MATRLPSPPPIDATASAGMYFRRGQRIFAAGDRVRPPAVVASGIACERLRSADGRESIAAVLGPGDLIGEIGRERHTFEAVAATACTLRPAPQDPGLLADLLERRLARARAANHILATGDRRRRLASMLLDLAGLFGRPGHDGIAIRCGLTQTDLAHLSGCSRESVNRTLAAFARRGWVRTVGSTSVVRDEEALRAFAESG